MGERTWLPLSHGSSPAPWLPRPYEEDDEQAGLGLRSWGGRWAERPASPSAGSFDFSFCFSSFFCKRKEKRKRNLRAFFKSEKYETKIYAFRN